MPIWRTLIITDRSLEILNDDELAALCAHELAHLDEPGVVSLLRVVASELLFLPLILARPVLGSFGPYGMAAMLLASPMAIVVTRRIGRRMEERADAAGRKHQREEGVYARALERIHEFNLSPVVMPGRRHVHPHLYDRLLAAGVQPPYARPGPPSGSLGRTAGFATLAVVVGLYGLFFVVASCWR